ARLNELRNERTAMAQQLDAAVAERDGAVADVARYENELRRARTTAEGALEEREMLRAGYTDLQQKHAEVLARVAELERALSDEQTRGREADEELRRLREAASSDARAVAAGRAEAHVEVVAEPVVEVAPIVEEEPDADDTPVVEDAEPIAKAEPDADADADADCEPEPDAESEPEGVAVDPLGRSVAMAELNAIAAFTEGEDFAPRRR
ncbi:MAG TPA: hypothetical protein VFX21_11150, partial [Acidimicrobiia bacterium]|nr:hypothetical protein [Acidimicrobiia bacterium]